MSCFTICICSTSKERYFLPSVKNEKQTIKKYIFLLALRWSEWEDVQLVVTMLPLYRKAVNIQVIHAVQMPVTLSNNAISTPFCQRFNVLPPSSSSSLFCIVDLFQSFFLTKEGVDLEPSFTQFILLFQRGRKERPPTWETVSICLFGDSDFLPRQIKKI